MVVQSRLGNINLILEYVEDRLLFDSRADEQLLKAGIEPERNDHSATNVDL